MTGVRAADIILINDEAWTVSELREVLEHPRCGRPHYPALRESAILELASRYRKGNLATLAAEYGVSPRTAMRYISRARRAPAPCPGPRCLTMVRGGGLCSFCRRTAEMVA
jgi:hypothetical protein